MRTTTICYPAILLALLLLTSCARLESLLKEQHGTPGAQVPAVAKKQVPSVAKKNEVRPAITVVKDDKALAIKRERERLAQKKEEINLRLEAGDFPAALEEIRREAGRGTPESDLAAEILPALNGAIAQAESQLQGNNPAQAGLLYRASLDGFPRDPELAAKVKLTAPELETKIGLCADKLMEKGLSAYRIGNLNDAIEIWKQVLVFQPQHQASQNAIQTAYTQLQNLKSITADQ